MRSGMPAQALPSKTPPPAFPISAFLSLGPRPPTLFDTFFGIEGIEGMDGYLINKNCAITGSMLAKAIVRSEGRSQRPAVESDRRPPTSAVRLPTSGIRPLGHPCLTEALRRRTELHSGA